MALPLEGIKVIDLSAVVSGPLATTVLADQGADVVVVEQVGKPDSMRSGGPNRSGMNAAWAVLNRSKRCIALDLGDERGKAVLRDLVAQADVLVQNFRPGAIDRMGFGYEAVRRRNPDIVFVSITGFGPDGPYSHKRVYDPIMQAITGVASIHADEHGKPSLVRTLPCDKVTAMYVAQGVTAALLARARGGGGTHVQVSMLDASLNWVWPESMWNHTFVDNATPFPYLADFYKVWHASDGFFAAIVITDAEFQAACRALGAAGLLDDARFGSLPLRVVNGAALYDELNAHSCLLTVAEAVGRLDAADVPAARINTRDDIVRDPQVVHCGSLVHEEHPGGIPVRQPRPPVRFGDDRPVPRFPAARYGEHTDAVLGELGLAPEAIEALRVEGVVA